MKKVIIIGIAILLIIGGGYLLVREINEEESPPIRISDEPLQDRPRPDAQIRMLI